MRSYSLSKPPSTIDPNWIFWSSADFENLSPDSNEIAALLYVTRKKEICLLYKPTPIKVDGVFLGIMGNLFDEGSTPAIVVLEAEEIGSCFAVQDHDGLPEKYRPEIPLEENMVSGTGWENAEMDISLISLPNLAPIPFGIDFQSHTFDDAFAKEMKNISVDHGFWAKALVDIIEQTELNDDAINIAERLISSRVSSRARDHTRAATKGIRDAKIASSGPFIESSLAGKKYEKEQEHVRTFFHRNPTPTRVELNDDDAPTIPIISTQAPLDHTLPPASPAAAPFLPQINNTNPPPNFYTQLIETMKKMQAPQQPQKIVVESRDHEESIDLAKLQHSMLRLMYVGGEVDWEEGTIKNLSLATFAQGFNNLLDRSAAVQAAQLTNLFTTIFTTESDEEMETLTNPLNRLMSLVCFPPKFTKGHLNASFQSSDLETGATYKSTSINPFQYAPQNNRALVKSAMAEIEETRNEINWKLVDKDRRQISSIIEGVGRVNTIEDVAMTCANMCGVQLAIVDITANKPLLFQFAMKVIRFIENKKTRIWMRDNQENLMHLPMVFMGKIHQFFQNLATFSQNSVNTNKVELGLADLDDKSIKIAIRLASKFFKKMVDHIDDNSLPKEVPSFAKNLFVEQTSGGFALAHCRIEHSKTEATQPTAPNESGKRKPSTEEASGMHKKQRKEFSDKSLKMGIFHIKKDAPAAKAIPDKSLLKDGAGICLDFCCQGRKCNFPHQLCKNGRHITNWKNLPDEDKLVLLKHMDSSGLMWLDAATFEKHKITISPEHSHLLGDATGPKQKST